MNSHANFTPARFVGICAHVIMFRMIDWASVAWNSCWIVGLSLLLATFSYNRWLSADARARNAPPTRLSPIYNLVGIGLTALGLMGTSRTLWEAGAWFGLAVAWMVFVWRSARPSSTPPEESHTPDGN